MKHTIFLAVLLCSAITATANNAKISGRIKDANDKSAIIGATVLLMQDTVQIAGTTTDNNGKFSLDADIIPAAAPIPISSTTVEIAVDKDVP